MLLMGRWSIIFRRSAIGAGEGQTVISRRARAVKRGQRSGSWISMGNWLQLLRLGVWGLVA